VKSFLFSLFALLALAASAQHGSENPTPEPADPHHHQHPFRAAVLLGHGIVPEVGGDGVLFVPTWGLDLDYHLSDRWSLGLHSDVEIENYLIELPGGEEVELEMPFISTLDVFYRLNHNILLGGGGGFTLENGEAKSLIRLAVEGEVPMNDRWEWTPTLFLDQRLDGRQVWTFAVGVAHYL